MFENHEITNRLPPLRDDEPASLRQDIADEILDHLHVALRKDLLIHGSDEAAARRRVLSSFGDPRQVARQLWFQAMWSKIMMQRLVIGGAIVSIAVCAALVGVVGLMMREQHQANVALLDQVARLVPSQSERPAEASPEKRLDNTKIKVTLGTKDGPAAQGFEVTVSKVPNIGDVVAQEGFTQENTTGQNHSKEETIRKHLDAETDAEGMVDCGYVEPGMYELSVVTPWNEATSSTFTVHPGKDHLEHVISPDKMPQMADVKLALDGLPDDLDSKRFALVLSFHPIGSREFAGREWSRGGKWFFGETMPFLMVVPRRGVWISNAHWNSGNTRWPDTIFRPDRDSSARWKRLEPPYHFQIPAHEYSVLFDFVRAPATDRPDDPNWSKNVLYEMNDMMLEWQNGRPSTVSDPSVVKLVAKAGQTNDWKIAVPKPVLIGWRQRVSNGPIQHQSPEQAAAFTRPWGRWFPFGINEPSLIREIRTGNGPILQLVFTEQQARTLSEIAAKCREFFVNHPPRETHEEDDIEMWRSRFAEFDHMVVDVLTPSQKAIWDQRKLQIKNQDRPLGFDGFELDRELTNEEFAQQIDLTGEQTRVINNLAMNRSRPGRGGRGGRGRGANPATNTAEINEMMLKVLTPDQMSVWEQRQGELKQELAAFEKKQAAKDAVEEATASDPVAPRPPAPPGRGGAPLRIQLPNENQPATDQDRIADLQQQIELLKVQIEKLKAGSKEAKPNEK